MPSIIYRRDTEQWGGFAPKLQLVATQQNDLEQEEMRRLWIGLALCSLLSSALQAAITAPQIFTPTSGQTAFTLSSSPAGLVAVFRNGVLLYSPGDYSISGNTLTMVTPASTGDVIQVADLLGGGNGVPNMLGVYSDANDVTPSSYISSDEVNKIITFTAKDVNGDGHPGGFVCGRITGGGPFTLSCDITPPQYGSSKLRLLDRTGTARASLQFNDLTGAATLNGFANPWPTANVASTPLDGSGSLASTTLTSVYNDLAQVSYSAFTRSAGDVAGSMTITVAWTEAITGTPRTFTTPAINLQVGDNSINGTLAVNSNGAINVSTAVTGNGDATATYHAVVKAIY